MNLIFGHRSITRLQTLLVLALSLFVAGCGFQLRGTEQAGILPDRQAMVRIEVPLGERAMADALERQLAFANAELTAGAADFVVTVQQLDTNQRTLALAGNLQAAALSVDRQTTVLMTDSATGNSRTAVLNAKSNYDYNRESPAASDHELAKIETELDGELARQIVLQLSNFSRSQQAVE